MQTPLEYNFEYNSVYEPALTDLDHRWIVLWGGGGSGKSVCAAQYCLERVIANTGERGLITRKVARTIRRSVWDEIIKQAHRAGCYNEFSVNQSGYTITNKRTGSDLIFAGLDDPEKIKSISGVTFCWHEEPTEGDENDYIQVDLRLRGERPEGSLPFQHIVSFNPVSAQSWIKKFFWEKRTGSSLRIHSTYKDNAYVDAEYGRQLEALAQTDPYFYQVYCKGEWGVLSGLIYVPWDFAEFPERFDDEFGCVDFGYNNPMAAMHVRVLDGQLYVRELVYQSGLQTAELCDLPEMKAIKNSVLFYGDAEDPGAIDEMCSRGYAVEPADKGKGSVKNGILLLRSLKIFSHANNVGLNKELSTYTWRKDSNGNSLEEPVKFNDHALDAVRYGVWTRMRHWTWVDEIYRKHGGGTSDD